MMRRYRFETQVSNPLMASHHRASRPGRCKAHQGLLSLWETTDALGLLAMGRKATRWDRVGRRPRADPARAGRRIARRAAAGAAARGGRPAAARERRTAAGLGGHAVRAAAQAAARH